MPTMATAYQEQWREKIVGPDLSFLPLNAGIREHHSESLAIDDMET